METGCDGERFRRRRRQRRQRRLVLCLVACGSSSTCDWRPTGGLTSVEMRITVLLELVGHPSYFSLSTRRTRTRCLSPDVLRAGSHTIATQYYSTSALSSTVYTHLFCTLCKNDSGTEHRSIFTGIILPAELLPCQSTRCRSSAM